MLTIASVLASIPATVWSGIIGAILALSGVLLSNRGNTSRLRIQLQHDAAEKAKERTAILRREVYLRAIEELVRANSHLAGLPNLDPTKVNIGDGLQGFFSAAARLQLVAEPKTALLVNRLVGEYGELLFELLAQLQPAHGARSHSAQRRSGEWYFGATLPLPKTSGYIVIYANNSSKQVLRAVSDNGTPWPVPPAPIGTMALIAK